MPEANQDVNPADASSDSALGEAIASSPEVQEVQEQISTESATPQQAEPKVHEPPQDHPRFKEVIEERNWYRQQLEQVLQRQTPPQQPTTDPFANMTPEEERFWRAVDQRAERIAEQKISKVNPLLEVGQRELANLKVQQFRNAHPDITPDSPEEIEIARKINQGYNPEDAYRVVMWDKKVVQAEKQANNNIKQKMEAKKQANVEQTSIPQGGLPPTKEKLTLRQRIEREAQKLEF
jgi:hypothetical protein